jgi:hypothetical protein
VEDDVSTCQEWLDLHRPEIEANPIRPWLQSGGRSVLVVGIRPTVAAPDSIDIDDVGTLVGQGPHEM